MKRELVTNTFEEKATVEIKDKRISISKSGYETISGLRVKDMETLIMDSKDEEEHNKDFWLRKGNGLEGSEKCEARQMHYTRLIDFCTMFRLYREDFESVIDLLWQAYNGERNKIHSAVIGGFDIECAKERYASLDTDIMYVSIRSAKCQIASLAMPIEGY